MSLTSEEFIKRFDEGTLKPVGGGSKCFYCAVTLQETVTGNRRVGKHRTCSDCYFTEFGKVLKKHPVITARIRRTA